MKTESCDMGGGGGELAEMLGWVGNSCGEAKVYGCGILNRERGRGWSCDGEVTTSGWVGYASTSVKPRQYFFGHDQEKIYLNLTMQE